MKKLFVPVAVLCLAVCGIVVAEELKSGLQPGSFPGPFVVTDITGPTKGEALCYRCKFGKQPVISIFARSADDAALAGLLKEVDGKIEKNKALKAFFVLLTDDAKGAEAKLAEIAKKHGIKNVPLTTFEGTAGPDEYQLSDKADVTVMMWVNEDVKVNHAYAKGKLDKAAIATIGGETKKILE